MAAEAEYTVGKSYFLKDGRECELLAFVKTETIHQAKYVVAPIIIVQDYHGDENRENGPVEFAHELFKKAPIEKRSAELAAVEADYKSAQEKLHAIRRECLDAAAEKVKIENFLGKYAATSRLIDFVEGRVTVIVRLNDEVFEKLSYAEWIRQESYYGKFPVISIVAGHGFSGPQWRTTVRDKNEVNMWPCMSDEEAEQLITDIIAEKFKKAVAEKSAYYIELAVRIAKKANRPIPVEFAKWLLERAIASDRSSISTHETNIATVNKSLAAKIAALEALNAPGQEGA